MNMNNSHYGYPELDQSYPQAYYDFIQNKLPDNDSELIYGFNAKVEEEIQSKRNLETLAILSPLYNLKSEHSVTHYDP